jgi:hypothetical protein
MDTQRATTGWPSELLFGGGTAPDESWLSSTPSQLAAEAELSLGGATAVLRLALLRGSRAGNA